MEQQRGTSDIPVLGETPLVQLATQVEFSSRTQLYIPGPSGTPFQGQVHFRNVGPESMTDE